MVFVGSINHLTYLTSQLTFQKEGIFPHPWPLPNIEVVPLSSKKSEFGNTICFWKHHSEGRGQSVVFDFGTLATPRHAKMNGWFEEIKLLPTFLKNGCIICLCYIFCPRDLHWFCLCPNVCSMFFLKVPAITSSPSMAHIIPQVPGTPTLDSVTSTTAAQVWGDVVPKESMFDYVRLKSEDRWR